MYQRIATFVFNKSRGLYEYRQHRHIWHRLLAIMAWMSEVNDEKIRAPKHVGPWSVRYSSGCADEWSVRSVSTSDWAKVKFDDEVVRWWWYRIRGKACESGWCACDSLWKVPAIRHLTGSIGTFCNLPPWLSPRCPTLGTFRMLSQTLQPLSHTLPLILYHHHLASSSSRVTSCCSLLIKVSFFIS